MATKYDNLHIKVSEPTTKIIKDKKMLKFVGTIDGENILEIQHCFAVKVSDAIDDEIVKAVTEEARKAGIHDVYLMDRDFIVNALRSSISRSSEPASCFHENKVLRHQVYVANDVNFTLKTKVKIQEDEIDKLKAELAKARGGCKRLRENKEELQGCVRTLKKCFDEERDARIKRDEQYAELFKKYEQLEKNCQHTNSYRPCYVEGRVALFHGWFTEPMRSFRNPEPTNMAYGLVEFENGNMRKVNPSEIRFMDDECRRVWETRK